MGIKHCILTQQLPVNALYSNTTAITRLLGSSCIHASNSAVGYQALYSNTTGANNTCWYERWNIILQVLIMSLLGSAQVLQRKTRQVNAALGYAALYQNTTGNNNTAVGLNAGRFIDGGADNTITSNSVFLGQNTRALAISQTNQIVIGESAVGLGSNTAILGNSSITKTQLQGNVGIGTASPSVKLEVNTASSPGVGTSLIQARFYG
jgi:hypothetical protein